jgi:hypothetical protein
VGVMHEWELDERVCRHSSAPLGGQLAWRGAPTLWLRLPCRVESADRSNTTEGGNSVWFLTGPDVLTKAYEAIITKVGYMKDDQSLTRKVGGWAGGMLQAGCTADLPVCRHGRWALLSVDGLTQVRL